MEYKFDNEFRFKNLPDESTPHNAENMNKALENTSWLKSQLDGTIEPKTGSNIEITDSAEAMLNKLEIEGKSYQETRSGKNLIDIHSDFYSSRIRTTINNETLECEATSLNGGVVIQLSANYELNKPLVLSFDATILNAKEDINSIGEPFVYFRSDSSGWTSENPLKLDNQKNHYEIKILNGLPKEDYKLWLYIGRGITTVAPHIQFDNIQLEHGENETDYEPYGVSPSPDYPSKIKSVGKLNEQGKYEIELTISKDDESKTTTFVLNEPLRSLPTGVKDLLYIKNGHLYINRNIEKYTFTGNENWKDASTICYTSIFANKIGECSKNTEFLGYSNSFFVNGYDYKISGNFYFHPNKNMQFDFDERFPSMESLTTFLKENETNIYYQLATPTTEDLGEIEMPSTFKDKSTITTTDELEPTINLEYVKDTILTNYVEKRLINLIK